MYQYIPRRRRKSSSSIPEITLTPLVDTALNLLIIFMVATPAIHNAIKVSLPRGMAKEVGNAQEELVVSIDKREKLFFNGKSVANSDTLIKELKRVVGDDKDKIVYLKADESVHYGLVTELVDQMKVVGGIAHVALSTRKA